MRTSTFTRPRSRPVSDRSELVHETENIYTVMDVLDDKVCEYKTKLITGDITFTVVDARGRKRTSNQLDNFVGETIQSTKRGEGWTHTLMDEAVNEKEQKALTQIRPFFQDRESCPADRQKFGASWDLDRDYIDILIRTNLSAASGKVKATFVKLVQHEGETCAAIECDGTIRGSIDFGVGLEKVGSILLSMNIVRSLKNGIDVKTDGQMRIQSTDTKRIQGAEFEVTTRSQVTISSSVVIER